MKVLVPVIKGLMIILAINAGTDLDVTQLNWWILAVSGAVALNI